MSHLTMWQEQKRQHEDSKRRYSSWKQDHRSTNSKWVSYLLVEIDLKGIDLVEVEAVDQAAQDVILERDAAPEIHSASD